MGIIEAILAFIVLVGILVFVHEMGHFLAARWTGMRADVFAIGMGPRLFGWNRKTGFSFGKLPEDLQLEGQTDYRISAFPIGGYVKILGMVDESMDTDFAARPPEPWEFRSKGTLAKVFVISAGVIMNLILAIILFSALNFFQGKELQSTTVVGPLPANGPALKAGLREGDKILAVNGAPVKYFDDIREKVFIDATDRKDIALKVERAGAPLDIVIPATDIPVGSQGPAGPIIPNAEKTVVEVKGVVEGAPADKAGFRPGDLVVSTDGVAIVSMEQLIEYIGKHDDRPIRFLLARKGAPITISVQPGDDGKIGTELANLYQGPKEHVDYGFFEAIGTGFEETGAVTAGTFGLVGKLITGGANLKTSVGGPVMIANVAAEAAKRGPDYFIHLMAVLSVTLACMNILPIPALDGGHLVFILVEGVMRREVPIKIRMAIQQVGFALLIIFMMFVLYNDATR
jgi:regulator of sigma E protease